MPSAMITRGGNTRNSNTRMPVSSIYFDTVDLKPKTMSDILGAALDQK